MRVRSCCLLLLIFVAALFPPLHAAPPPQSRGVKPFRYVVKTGDTPSGLAAKWGVPATMIAREGQTLRAGDVVAIPLSERRRIRRGDALWDLSKHYGIPLETLAKFNNLAAPYVLRRGRILMIPELGSRSKSRKK